MRIAVAATPEVALPTLEALRVSSHELAFVISRADAPAGRGRELRESPVAQWAQRSGVEVKKPDTSDEIGALVKGLDLVLTIGYGFILPENILQIPTHGFINLHFSLLPRWRGAAPVQRAIEAGDSITGVTVFKLDKGMDTGPIYRTAQTPLSNGCNSAELFEILAALGVKPVLDTLELIAAGEQPIVQNEAGSSRAKKLSKEEGHIDWSKEAIDIERKVNAFYGNPGAWSYFRGQILKIDKVNVTEHVLPRGYMEVIDKKVLVGTSTCALELVEVTPAGKATLAAAAWANGARITSKDLLN